MKNKILSSIILILILLCTSVYATDEEIPSKYDLRNDISIEVENQKQTSLCGIYAEQKMIETYIQKTKGINYNLSIGYFSHWNDFGGTYGKHVLESDFPTKEYAINETNQKKFDEATKKAVIEKFEYAMNINKDVETVKKYIMNYGGTFASIQCDRQTDRYKGGIYRKDKFVEERPIGHAIVIIGWDDNYSKDNFYYEKPENDGAWLVLNSWGTQWGNNGTAWLSYEDKCQIANGCYGIESLTLANGEIIETKLEDEKQEEKTTEVQVVEQQETQKEKNIFEKIADFFKNIFGF